jgi:hypothetical protein
MPAELHGVPPVPAFLGFATLPGTETAAAADPAVTARIPSA